MNKKILAVTNIFPFSYFPEKGIFVQNILGEFVKQKMKVDVIAPISFTEFLKNYLLKKGKKNELEFIKLKLNVKQPFYLSISSRLPFNKQILFKISSFFFRISINRNFTDKNYSFIYSHFISSAIPTLKLAREKNIPLFVNVGESSLSIYDKIYGKNLWLDKLDTVDGIIAVSKENFDYLKMRRLSLVNKMTYIPNGVDTSKFIKIDKNIARKELCLDSKKKIVLFCGHFIERKGPLRVLKAIRETDIYGIFLGGNGKDLPNGDRVIFAGSVPNDRMSLYYSAADVFVLPSLEEGMSNAVLEAMVCGLPLVVSDRAFNTDFLTSDVANFIDPTSVSSIKKGIKEAFEPNNNNKMSEASLSLGKQYTIEKRIKKIISFVDSTIED